MRSPDLRDRAVEIVEDGCDHEARAPLGAVAAQLCRPPVERARAGEQVVGAAGGHGVESGAERRAHRARDRIGPGEHHLGGHAVAIELPVAGGGVPAAAQTELVEAVALVVLAEPLLLELLVADEVARRRRSLRVDEGLPFGQLLVEVVAELWIEVVAVGRRVRPRMAVG